MMLYDHFQQESLKKIKDCQTVELKRCKLKMASITYFLVSPDKTDFLLP